MAKARGLARAGAGGLAIIRAPPDGRRSPADHDAGRGDIPAGAQAASRGAVHVASALVTGREVDEAYLRSVGVIDKLPQWRGMLEPATEAA